jgi:osmoprotectant transport system substrate-binding protein
MKVSRVILAGGLALAVLPLSACSASKPVATADAPASTTTARTLPGAGKPQVTIGDKNFTEQFLLGELYAQALSAQGYTVQLNRNIGPTEVTMQAIYSGRLDMYPEYLSVWNSDIAGYKRGFGTAQAAYRAARRYARVHGLRLLAPTPFSDTPGIAVTSAYGSTHRLRTIADLRKVAATLALGAPPEFQQAAGGLGTLENVYGFVPATFTPLAIGAQYQALNQGTVQAAEVNTTDGQLGSGDYTVLRDPAKVFGWGQAVPVVPVKVLAAEGPAFAATINRVSGLLATAAMQELNAQVDVYQQDPATVAKEFLQAHGLVPLASS